jgi:hypothetical protein
MTESENTELSFSLDGRRALLRSILERQTRLISKLLGNLIGHPAGKDYGTKREIEADVKHVLTFMLQAIGSSATSLLVLLKESGLRALDCYSISRSIVESAINICFIIAKGESEAQRALRHAGQKSFRDLFRESSLGASTIRIVYGGSMPEALPDELKAAMDEFTSAAGREKGWSNLSVDERIAETCKELGQDLLNQLHGARFMVYRHASEILHGSAFGIFYFMGLTQPRPPESLESFKDSIAGHQLLVFTASIIALDAVFKAIHKRYICETLENRRQLLAKERQAVSKMVPNADERK